MPPPGLLDRHGRVDSVLVVQVDVLDPESLERGITGAPNVVRLTIDPDEGAVFKALISELGGEKYFLAPAGDRPADETLVGVRAVRVGGVKERHAQIQRAVTSPWIRRRRRPHRTG